MSRRCALVDDKGYQPCVGPCFYAERAEICVGPDCGYDNTGTLANGRLQPTPEHVTGIPAEFAQLATFYDAADMAALVRAQAEHIEGLQAKLPPTPPYPGPTFPRG